MSLKSRPLLILLVIVLALVAIGVVVYSKLKPDGQKPGQVLDEARVAQRAASTFPAADEDYFHDMDGGVQLSPDEIKGRNTWIVWTAGNDRFWDKMVDASVGALDFVKILSSHPGLPNLSRDNRWEYLGLVNDPCFEKAPAPIRSVLVSGSINVALIARPIPSRTNRSIRESKSARVERILKPVLTMATRPALSDCVSFRTRTSTKLRRNAGTRRSITPTGTITTRKISFDLIASECRAASVTLGQIL
jgi:hypothetical protein